MIFNSQVEYNKFYDRMKRYANYQARRLFSDTGLRIEAVDTALDTVVDKVSANEGNIANIDLYSQGIIRNSLKSSARHRKLDVSKSSPEMRESGMRVRQIVSNGNYPGVKLSGIGNDKERNICLLYWEYGLKQEAIATQAGVSQQYVSQIIVKYSK